MNCDEAFDALTDPTQAQSPELESHLAACARCRQMQQILEPAIGLFDSATTHAIAPADERSKQPVISAEAIQLAERTARELSERRTVQPAPRPESARRFPRTAIALLGAAAALGFAAFLGLSMSSAQECLWQQHARGDAGNVTAARAVQSCVACHMHDGARAARTMDELPAAPAGRICFWQVPRQPHSESPVRVTVVSCVACHVSEPAEMPSPIRDLPQASVNGSADLLAMLQAPSA